MKSVLAIAALSILLASCGTKAPVQNSAREMGENVEAPVAVEEEKAESEEAGEATSDVSAESTTYSNAEQGYSLSYPEGWHYKETEGPYYSQAVGFNPNVVSDEDYQVIVAVLAGSKQAYLSSYDENSNLKIVKELGDFPINGLAGSKFTYQNLATEKTFSVYTITSGDKTYVIIPDESVESTFLNSFEVL